MRPIQIELRQVEIDAIVQLARVERRRPTDQAAVLIVEALRRRGWQDPTLQTRPADQSVGLCVPVHDVPQ